MEFHLLNVKRAARGDERAFEALIQPYADATYRLCLHMMGNEQDAADMAQEAFLRAWRSLSTYKGQSRFSTWLFRVTTNVCLDELRKRSRGKAESMQVLEESGFEPVDPGETPEMALDRAELRRDLRSAIAQLNEEQRAALILRDIQGLPYEEIAKALDLNLNTVKSRIARARGALREILRGKTELSAKKRV
ncbi:MAG: RNA polymerase sigma factor [Candidatus Spyradocola sp.]|jgi:RNA polymerase sigma-70 factor (ECF subfamily)